MYFSNQEFLDYAGSGGNHNYYRNVINLALGRNINTAITKSASRRGLYNIKKSIADRNSYAYSIGTAKWLRPWDVVPKLRDFQAPEGDFGVGFEVELGFTSAAAAKQVTKHVFNWKYITLDFEGGVNPIECTFAPILYSKFNKRSQAIRYLEFLTANSSIVIPGNGSAVAGTHVNVSMGSTRVLCGDRLRLVNNALSAIAGGSVMSYNSPYDYATARERTIMSQLAVRYFGRRPYGLGYMQGNGRWIEWKLFNSTIDSKRFRQYVDIAVELTRLVGTADAVINAESVLRVLEYGYHKSLISKRGKKTAFLFVDSSSAALAA